MTFALMLIACTALTLEEQSDTYTWSGFVYADIPADTVPGLTAGAIEVRDANNEQIALGEQPNAEDPATWRITLRQPEPVSIRISGPQQLTTVWRTQSPPATSYWFSGAFFAVQPTTLVPLWDALAELTGEPFAVTDGAHLYGEPLALSDEDVEAWTGANITVYDGDGVVHPVVALSTTEDGFTEIAGDNTGPISSFTATDLAPGNIRLVIDASDGRTVVMDYFAEPGDLLSAFAFTLPSS